MKFLLILSFVLLSLLSTPTLAQQAPDGSKESKTESETPPQPECSPVIFNRQTLFCFHLGVGAYSSKERAHSVENRLKSASEDPSISLEEIQAKKQTTSFDIFAAQNILVSLTEADVTNMPLVSLEEYAQQKAEEIKTQIRIDRSKRSPREIALGSTYSLLSLIALLIVFSVLSAIFRRFRAIVDRHSPRIARFLKFHSYELVTEQRVSEVLHWLLQVSHVLTGFFVVYIFIPLALSFFPWTANFAPVVWGYILHPLSIVWHHVIDYLPKLVFIIVISFLAYYLLKFVRFIFLEIEKGTIHIQGFYREWAMPTYKLARFFILALVLVIVFPYLPGSSSPAFQGVSVFLGLIISFGSSSAIANIVAGVVLTYMRPFKIGDRVKIADTVGDVIEKNLLITRIRSIKNVDITVPNAMVLGSHIVNYSSSAESKGLILNMTVTVGYSVPWREVNDALIEAARRTELILESPKPFILQTGFHDFNASYELNAYTRNSQQMAVLYSKLYENVQDVFREAKIELLSPHHHQIKTTDS